MTETQDVIARRYACRAFTGAPVPVDTLRQIATAGLHAPSAVNLQPWRLVVIPTKAQVDAIDAAGLAQLATNDPEGYARIQTRGGRLLYNASAMILVTISPRPGPYPAELDAGIVVSHLVLSATSQGVNSCVVAMSRWAFEGLPGARLRRQYIPDGFEFAISVLLGYAVDPSGTPHAIDSSKVIWADSAPADLSGAGAA